MLSLNIITAFNQLNIERITEVLPSLSELNFFLYKTNFKIVFKFEELRFFDPELFEEYGTDNLIYLGKDTIYRNVHLFIERIRDIAKIKISTIV
jgi:hypothetical protein